MATPVKMLRLSKSMNTGTVLQWLKTPGDLVQEGEALLHVLSEKADVQVEAPATGTLLQILVAAGAEAPVGSVLAWIGQPGEVSGLPAGAYGQPAAGPGKPPAVQSPDTALSPSSSAQGGSKISPLARRMAKEHNISLEAVMGSGPGGIITKGDIEQVVQAKAAGAKKAQAAAAVPTQTPDDAAETATPQPQGEARESSRIPLEGMRRVMAERMALSKRTAADVTTVVDVDMGAIRGLKEHIPITYTSAVVKAVALGLRQHTMLNSAIEIPGSAGNLPAGDLPAGTMILLHKQIHIGVAVDAPRGLMVVTIANADQKSLRQVDEELRQLSEATKTGSLRVAEMESPTFTVTNSGVLGSLMFTPIINPPQSATLGMGKVQETPVVRQGQIVARPVMYLCLTYDHRIVEGAAAVRFLVDVKGMLEDPARML